MMSNIAALCGQRFSPFVLAASIDADTKPFSDARTNKKKSLIVFKYLIGRVAEAPAIFRDALSLSRRIGLDLTFRFNSKYASSKSHRTNGSQRKKVGLSAPCKLHLLPRPYGATNNPTKPFVSCRAVSAAKAVRMFHCKKLHPHPGFSFVPVRDTS
jgi:hypothetical protein